MHRVLGPSGAMLLSVPLGHEESTREYGRPDPMESGHWRRYGRDATDRLREPGFSVRTLEPFSSGQMDKYGIQPEPMFICEKSPPLT